MGTNYYWRHNTCDCCGRHDVTHVGKSSSGWVFSWHGYRPSDNLEWEPHPPIVTAFDGRPVDSTAAWTEVLRTVPGQLWDEYGKQRDVEEFLALVEGKREPRPNGDPPMTHKRWDAEHARYALGSNDSVADPSGDDVAFYEFC